MTGMRLGPSSTPLSSMSFTATTEFGPLFSTLISTPSFTSCPKGIWSIGEPRSIMCRGASMWVPLCTRNGQHRNRCPTVDCDIAVQRHPLGLQLRFLCLGYGGDDIDLGRVVGIGLDSGYPRHVALDRYSQIDDPAEFELNRLLRPCDRGNSQRKQNNNKCSSFHHRSSPCSAVCSLAISCPKIVRVHEPRAVATPCRATPWPSP